MVADWPKVSDDGEEVRVVVVEVPTRCVNVVVLVLKLVSPL